MSDIQFGRLQDLDLRDAWSNEATDFTPWLADNIDHLSELIGIPLEVTGTEVAVGTFAADILARSPADDSVVLIENQLAGSDHGHLGQIMTYLAGLDAHIVIWIAPTFREQHLSAISWLNQHTDDDFSFFAIRLRVVRIGDSPFAPVMEIAEKPNDWDRQVRTTAATESASYYDIKQQFWKAFLKQYPEMEALGIKPWKYPNNYVNVAKEPCADISIYIGKRESGIFVRPGREEPTEPLAEIFNPHQAHLQAMLETVLAPSGKSNHFLVKSIKLGHEHHDKWPEIMKWMKDQISQYSQHLKPLF